MRVEEAKLTTESPSQSVENRLIAEGTRDPRPNHATVHNNSEPRAEARWRRETHSVVHENEIGTIVIESAITIHRELGPGLLETVYEIVLAHELKARGLEVQRQVPVPNGIVVP